jgi:N-acetylglucosaminyldiphosphoundecaprenol N-acetyl-beta-D-mannosaminyltransferase
MNSRFNFLGVNISVTNFRQALLQIGSGDYTLPAYICFPDSFVVSVASKDPELTSILNRAYLTMPDGKPSEIAAHLQGFREVSTVSGYHLCRALLDTGMSHYFYGGDEQILEQLKRNLAKKFPKANILGFRSPPFLQQGEIRSSKVIQNDIDEIRRLKPDLVWVGISSPKQDLLMSHYYTQLDQSLMLGIGGVFLYFADETLISPEWIKKAGLRWLYRLVKEPARLWPKYYGTLTFLVKNCSFFVGAYFQRKST